MSKGKRRTTDLTTAQITEKITELDNKINALVEETKALRAEKKELGKLYIVAEKKEAKQKEEEQMKELVSLISEKGLSVDKVKELLEQDLTEEEAKK